MNHRILAALIAFALAGNCLAQESQHGGDASHASHHPQAKPALMAFHDLMEPLWHSRPGKETNARACQLADEALVRAKAAAVRPTTDHAALIRGANALKKSCGEGKDEDIETGLAVLHGIFHRLAAM